VGVAVGVGMGLSVEVTRGGVVVAGTVVGVTGFRTKDMYTVTSITQVWSRLFITKMRE